MATHENQSPNKEDDATLFQILHSLLASFFGVQTQENMDRDERYIEKHGIKVYIILGFFLVFCLIITLLMLVKIIIHFAV